MTKSLELGRLCFSLNYRQTLIGLTTFSFVFIARVTPLAPQTSKVTVQATATALLVSSYWQFLQKEHVSAIFKVLGKGLNTAIKREFLQMPRTDEHHDKAPSCSGVAEGRWFAGACLTCLMRWYGHTLRAERSRAHIFNNLPKVSRGENRIWL